MSKENEKINSDIKIDDAERDYRKIMQISMRKNLLGASIYELIIAAIFLALPYVLVELLQIDTLYPLITLQNIPIWQTIGYILVSFIGLQFIYALFIPLFDGKRVGKIVGYIVGIFMLTLAPTGTFFGIMLLQDLRNPTRKTTPQLTSSQVKMEMGKNITGSGLLMLNIPIVLLIVQRWILTVQIDMLYPIITVKIIQVWEIMMLIYIALFVGLVVIGILYPKHGDKAVLRVLAGFFAGFQILSLGIAIQAYLWAAGPSLELDADLSWILNLGWLIGVLLNPLGLYFGSMMLRGLAMQKKIVKAESKR
jgi:hypothetical protein